MISDSLIQTKFAGKDGFTWWIGKVARPEDVFIIGPDGKRKRKPAVPKKGLRMKSR